MMFDLLIKNCHVLDESSEQGYRSGINIYIADGRIEKITTQLLEVECRRVLDGSRRLLIPGLVNAHSHSPETLGRASHDRLPLEPWLFSMISGLGVFTPRDHYLAAMQGAMETLLSGGTAILDHLTLPGGFCAEVLEAVMQAYKDVGIRARVAPIFRDGSAELAQTDLGGRFALKEFGEPGKGAVSMDEMAQVLRSVAATWHGAEGGRLRFHVGPGGIQWATTEFLHQCNALSKELGMGVHTHLMETRIQHATVQQLHGKSAVEMLVAEQLLDERWSLPHSIWLSDSDVRHIAASGAVPVHNPAANLRLGSGWSPIRKFIEAGALPALGADGSMSSDHQNVFGILHLAAQMHNCTYPDPQQWISSIEAMQMATSGGARALLQAHELGKIEAGYLADLTLLDLDHISMVPMHHAFHQLAYTLPSGAVHTVIVDGKVVVEDGRLTTIDSAAIIAEIHEAAAALPLRSGIGPDNAAEVQRLLTEYRHFIQHETPLTHPPFHGVMPR